jgi:hypothetical protein
MEADQRYKIQDDEKKAKKKKDGYEEEYLQKRTSTTRVSLQPRLKRARR